VKNNKPIVKVIMVIYLCEKDIMKLI